MLLKILEHIQNTRTRNLSISHKGIVVDNTDAKKLGRVKCWIEGLVEDSTLDCYPRNPSGLGGSPDSSFFGVPDEGSELEIRFPTMDIYFPIY